MDERIRNDDLLTSTEAAALLRVTLRTLYRYIHTDIIPYVRIGGRLRVSRTDLTTWLHEQRHLPSAPVGTSGPEPLHTHLPSRHISVTSDTDQKIAELRRIAGFATGTRGRKKAT